MIAEGILLKQFGILLIGSVKFLVAAPVSFLFGYSYLHTLINTSVGGLIGVLVFFFLSRVMLKAYFRHSPLVFRAIEQFTGITLTKADDPSKKRKAFNRRNRIIIKIRRKFGYFGIVILTPVLFSIPVGTFLAQKYYSKKRGLLAMLSLSVLFWSVVLTTFTALF